jgi:hypothetical protein
MCGDQVAGGNRADAQDNRGDKVTTARVRAPPRNRSRVCRLNAEARVPIAPPMTTTTRVVNDMRAPLSEAGMKNPPSGGVGRKTHSYR